MRSSRRTTRSTWMAARRSDHRELKAVGWGRFALRGEGSTWAACFAGSPARAGSDPSRGNPISGRWASKQVPVEPRGIRSLPSVKNLDVRLEKTFPLPHSSGTLGVFADVFNVDQSRHTDACRRDFWAELRFRGARGRPAHSARSQSRYTF